MDIKDNISQRLYRVRTALTSVNCTIGWPDNEWLKACDAISSSRVWALWRHKQQSYIGTPLKGDCTIRHQLALEDAAGHWITPCDTQLASNSVRAVSNDMAWHCYRVLYRKEVTANQPAASGSRSPSSKRGHGGPTANNHIHNGFACINMLLHYENS